MSENTLAERVDVLVLEDEVADSILLEAQLAAASSGLLPVRHAETLCEALREVRERQPDLAFVDLSVPDSRGPETVSKLLEASPDLPVVVLSGLDDEHAAIQAVRLGAQDYLVKGKVTPTLLRKSIDYAIERQRLFSELRSSKKRELEIKDRFLSHVSHELRTPLNALFQFLSILIDGIGGELNEAQSEYAGIALRNAKQLERMIGDLMDVTRLNSDKLALFLEQCEASSFAHACHDSFRERARTEGVELTCSVAPGLPPVVADPSRSRQVLSNLVENAIKFTPSGGAVSISVTRVGDRVEYVVEDTGPGIDAESVERVFDRLWQVEGAQTRCRKGLGLGLYISKQFAQLQGGDLTAERREEGGSRFRYSLPVYSFAGWIEGRVRAAPGASSLVLLSVGVTSGRVGAESKARALRNMRRVIEEALACGDCIAPHAQDVERVTSLRVVVAADANSCDALAERVRAALEDASALWRDGFATTVAATELPVSELPGGDAELDARDAFFEALLAELGPECSEGSGPESHGLESEGGEAQR